MREPSDESDPRNIPRRRDVDPLPPPSTSPSHTGFPGISETVAVIPGAMTYTELRGDVASPRSPNKPPVTAVRRGKSTNNNGPAPPPWRTTLSQFVQSQLLSTPGASLVTCPHILIALCRHPYPLVVSASYQHLFNLYEERLSLASALAACVFEPGAGEEVTTARPPAFAVVEAPAAEPAKRLSFGVGLGRSNRVVPMEVLGEGMGEMDESEHVSSANKIVFSRALDAWGSRLLGCFFGTIAPTCDFQRFTVEVFHMLPPT
jgi:hypothetical protein